MKALIEELGGCLYVILLGKILLTIMGAFYGAAG